MLSVLIATHNGADTIERTLAAMAKMAEPVGGWELLVVDNASNDDTAARAREWADQLPLRLLSQSRLGKAFAINLALDEAAGDFIIMTDDDIPSVRCVRRRHPARV
jgi:glycosyltransferase involved in cell wall biosynthesis